MSSQSSRHDLARILAWYRDMGVDCAVAAHAENWLARPDRPPGAGFSLEDDAPEAEAATAVAEPVPPRIPHAPPPQAVARPQAPAAPSAAETAARRAAREAQTLDALGAALAAFDGCPLKATAKNLCFYRGAAQARVMLIGEAPGREEDLAGKPFVGPAGQLLDKMLAAIGLDETSVHITNIVYWRPPGNRTPTAPEAQTCRPFLDRQVELVAPQFVVALGGAAAKELLAVSDGILRTRGRWLNATFGSRAVRAIAMLHPAYLLRTPAAKRLAWRDLLMLKAALAEKT